MVADASRGHGAIIRQVDDELRRQVDSASEGDARAVAALLVRMLPSLERHLQRHAGGLVRAKESIADLAQSVCREVLESLRDQRLEFEGEPQFVQWLQQAAIFKLQNRHRYYRADRRDAARERPRDSSSMGTPEPLARTPSPSGAAIGSENAADLRTLLATLPQRDRDVIQWCHFEGLGHEAVGERLGVSPSHSRVLLARAMAKLAKAARSRTTPP